MQVSIFTTFAFACFLWAGISEPPEGVHFVFKKQAVTLTAPARQGSVAGSTKGEKGVYFPHGRYENARLDTLSNWFEPASNYVEIIRQDDPFQPSIGLALGFEFDEENGEFPYMPSRAVLQLKDFGWGGVEFSLRDTMNYTGVSNDVSEDLQIEVDGFQNDTIWGRFSGLLVSGAGPMASIEEGSFKVKVYRVE